MRRRKDPPSADWFCHSPLAARHSACAARPRPRRVRDDRIFFRPFLSRPDCWTTGASPSQAQKSLTVGKRLMSRPISLTTTRAVMSAIPSSSVRSMPVT